MSGGRLVGGPEKEHLMRSCSSLPHAVLRWPAANNTPSETGSGGAVSAFMKHVCAQHCPFQRAGCYSSTPELGQVEELEAGDDHHGSGQDAGHRAVQLSQAHPVIGAASRMVAEDMRGGSDAGAGWMQRCIVRERESQRGVTTAARVAVAATLVAQRCCRLCIWYRLWREVQAVSFRVHTINP